MSISDYIEVSKPRIVIVLVIVAVTSLLAGSRFDNTPNIGWDVSFWQIGFLSLAGALASMGSSALNHYYDRDIDKIMLRTSNRPLPAGRLASTRCLSIWTRYMHNGCDYCVDHPKSCSDRNDHTWNILLRYCIYSMA